LLNSNNSYIKQREERSPASTDDMEEDTLDGLEVSLFDGLITLLELMQKDMLLNILSYVADDVTARSRPYRKDK